MRQCVRLFSSSIVPKVIGMIEAEGVERVKTLMTVWDYSLRSEYIRTKRFPFSGDKGSY